MGTNLTEYRITDMEKIKTLDFIRCGDPETSDIEESAKEEAFLKGIAEKYVCDTDFCILLGYGTFDIDTEKEMTHGFIICSICPCVPDKSALAFDVNEETLRDRLKDIPISAALNGFLFPAYENGTPDSSRVLYYQRKKEPAQTELTDDLFGIMETIDEKEILNGILNKDGDKSVSSILNVYSNAADYLEKSPDGTIDVPAMARILEDAGIDASDKKREIKDLLPSGKLTSFAENGYLTLKSDDFILRIPLFKADDIKIKKEAGIPYLMLKVDLGDKVDVNGLVGVLSEE